MELMVPIVRMGHDPFVAIPDSVRLAILLPTARWEPLTRSIIGSLIGAANEEVAVLIADNSENPEKVEFLRKLRHINPYIIAVSHEKNVGAHNNFIYLHDWCKNVEYSAIMADDDWMSPTYHVDAMKCLLENNSATCASAGTSYVDIGDNKLVDVGQPSMRGNTPLERIRLWNSIAARVTMYNTSRRSALDAALEFMQLCPIHGLTLIENLWELNRLALGDFLNVGGRGCFVHYPAHGAHSGDSNQRFYNLLCKDAGLQYPFVYFTGLSSAILCAIFLIGKLSPISDPEQRVRCTQLVFRHIYVTTFLPSVSADSSHEAASQMFAQYPEALAGFTKFCKNSSVENLIFNQEMVRWFIEIIKVFETRVQGDHVPLSERFRLFVSSLMGEI